LLWLNGSIPTCICTFLHVRSRRARFGLSHTFSQAHLCAHFFCLVFGMSVGLSVGGTGGKSGFGVHFEGGKGGIQRSDTRKRESISGKYTSTCSVLLCLYLSCTVPDPPMRNSRREGPARKCIQDNAFTNHQAWGRSLFLFSFFFFGEGLGKRERVDGEVCI